MLKTGEAPATADLVDAFPGEVRGSTLALRLFGRRSTVGGVASTVRVFEDNLLVREVLSEPGEGRILIVDGGHSRYRALLGDQLATLGIDNGWSGAIVLGAIRDSVPLDSLDFHVKALATQPLKSRKTGAGEREVPVRLGEAEVFPGNFVYSDPDGILVSDRRLHS
jgi:regulator of ribonuclease activity A